MEINWQTALDRASEVGASYLTNRNEPKKNLAAPVAPPPQPWLKFALIGGAVLAVVGILVAVFKK